MNAADVFIIPFPGKPLELEIPEAGRMFFPAPERGFLVGPENRFLLPGVHWLVEGIAPEHALPMTFFGPSGCGKTHLLQGIENAWHRVHQGTGKKKRSYYLTATDFARQYAAAVETKTMDEFRRRYRTAALFILDNLGDIAEKPAAQDELLFTTDELLANDSIVVFGDSSFPGEGGRYSERLTARLLGGTALPVSLPGPAVRLRFLRELASAFQNPLPTAALEFAVKELPLSIPVLHGIFAQMLFEARSDGATIDTAYVKSYLKKRLIADRPTIAGITKQSAKHFSLTLADIRGKSRSKTVANARAVAVYLVREKTGLSLKEIGEYFGGRDHTTIRYLVSHVETSLATDSALRDAVLKLR